MQAKEIYDILRAGGLSRAGALGMLGNMMAESTPALKPDIVQRGMTDMTDEEYTRAADDGKINFARDGAGYGLCQWTYWSRKQGLLEYAREMGVSVGDGVMQCYYCLGELREDYPELFKFLCTSDNIDECTDRICREYERPAVNNYMTRRDFAHKCEREIPAYTPPIKEPVSATFPPDPTVLALQLWLNYNGYTVECNGYKSKGFFDVLQTFVDDMKKC